MKFSEFLKEHAQKYKGEFNFTISNFNLRYMKKFYKKFNSIENFEVYYDDFKFLLVIENEIIYQYNMIYNKSKNYFEILQSIYNKDNNIGNFKGKKVTERFFSFLLNCDFDLLCDKIQSEPARKIWYNLSEKYKTYIYDYKNNKIISKINLNFDDKRIYSEYNINDKESFNIRILLSKNEYKEF